MPKTTEIRMPRYTGPETVAIVLSDAVSGNAEATDAAPSTPVPPVTPPRQIRSNYPTLDQSRDNFRFLRGDSLEFLQIAQGINRDNFYTTWICQTTQLQPHRRATPSSGTSRTTTEDLPPPPQFRSLYQKFMCVVPLVGSMTCQALTGAASNATSTPTVQNTTCTGSSGNMEFAEQTADVLDGKFRQMVDAWPLIKMTFDAGFANPCLKTTSDKRKIWKFHFALLIKGHVIIVEQKWVLQGKTGNHDDLIVRCMVFKEDHFRGDVVDQIQAQLAALGF